MQAMKLCISTLACPDWNLAQICDALESNSIGGIDFRGLGSEIDITRLPAFTTRLSETLGELDRRNLKMPCLNTSIALVTPAPDRWEMMLDECTRYAMLAAATRTKFLRIFGGSVPSQMSREEARLLGRRHLRQLVKICQNRNCTPLLETHDAWATSEEARELLCDFSPEEAGILWDFEHSWRKGEPVLDTAQQLSSFIRHAHIKDSIRVESKNSPRLLGEGELPLRQFLGALKAINYSGWLCLETEKRWHADAPDPEQSIPQFAQWINGQLTGG